MKRSDARSAGEPRRNKTLFENFRDWDKLLSAKELAERLSVDTHTIRNWRHRKMIPAVKLGPQTVKYRWGDIVEWIRVEGI
jgi:excisionase family DNA binding protein